MYKNAIVFMGANHLNYYESIFYKFKEIQKILICGPYSFSTLTSEQRNLFIQVEVVKIIPFINNKVELFDPEDALAVFEKITRSFKNIQLYCDDEKYLIVTAHIREKYSLAGLKLNQIMPFRDKVLMKELVQSKGISTPKFFPFDLSQYEKSKLNYLNKIEGELSLPFVVKPVNMAGSYGVSIVDTPEKFTTLNIQDGLEYEAEEFIDGILYHYDAVVGENQEIFFDEVCENINPLADFLNDKIFGSIIQKSELNKDIMLEFGRNIIQKLKIECNVIHLEFFMKKAQSPVFLEIGLRPGGSDVPEIYKQVFDINIFEQHFLANLKMLNKIQKNYKYDYCFIGYFPIKAGKITALTPPPIKLEGNINYFVKIGDINFSPSSILNVAGCVKITSNSHTDFEHDLSILKNWSFFDTNASDLV